MNIQFEHLAISSVKLWIENTLLKKGAAFSNATALFYPVQNVFNGYYTYALPYQPVVSDASIPGANVMSGVYLSGTYITPGHSGLVDVNFEKAEAYFGSEINSAQLSGQFSVADFSVKLTAEPEEVLLFEDKLTLKSPYNVPVSGIDPNATTYPVIFIKNYGGRSDPFAFGGTDKQMINIRLIVLADSQFASDGVGSIFKEKTRTLIPLLTGVNEMPFNDLGGYNGKIYNYTQLMAGRNTSSNCLWVENVDVNSLNGGRYSELRKINRHAFVSIIDLNLECYRNVRG